VRNFAERNFAERNFAERNFAERTPPAESARSASCAARKASEQHDRDEPRVWAELQTVGEWRQVILEPRRRQVGANWKVGGGACACSRVEARSECGAVVDSDGNAPQLSRPPYFLLVEGRFCSTGFWRSLGRSGDRAEILILGHARFDAVRAWRSR
jgi:hypothetical protein